MYLVMHIMTWQRCLFKFTVVGFPNMSVFHRIIRSTYHCRNLRLTARKPYHATVIPQRSM